MFMIVYVVEINEVAYDSWYVEGVFSSIEAAENYVNVRRQSGDDFASVIVQYELDNPSFHHELTEAM